jgi:hypothetical protein
MFFLQDLSKKKTLSMPASCRFFIRKTDEISRTHPAFELGKKSYQNKWVILGQ